MFDSSLDSSCNVSPASRLQEGECEFFFKVVFEFENLNDKINITQENKI